MRGRKSGSRSVSDFSDGTAARVASIRRKLMFFGHSQGGLTGPAFVAFEPAVKGAVFSGTGGILYLSLLDKTQPIDISDARESADARHADGRGQPDARARADVDRARRRRELRALLRARAADSRPTARRSQPRNIFQSEGFIDTYAPNPSIEAFATAVGGDLVMTDRRMPVDRPDACAIARCSRRRSPTTTTA